MNDGDDDGLAEVIPLPRPFVHNEREAKLDDECVVRTTREVSPCRHGRSFVDRAARKVTCRACGVELDPIDVLDEIARRREAIVNRGMMLRHQVDDLAKQVETLTRVEKNAKSRIRTARKRLQTALDEGAVDAACAAAYDSRRLLGYTETWEQLPEARRAGYREQVYPALEAFVGYEAPETDEAGVETA